MKTFIEITKYISAYKSVNISLNKVFYQIKCITRQNWFQWIAEDYNVNIRFYTKSQKKVIIKL